MRDSPWACGCASRIRSFTPPEPSAAPVAVRSITAEAEHVAVEVRDGIELTDPHRHRADPHRRTAGEGRASAVTVSLGARSRAAAAANEEAPARCSRVRRVRSRFIAGLSTWLKGTDGPSITFGRLLGIDQKTCRYASAQCLPFLLQVEMAARENCGIKGAGGENTPRRDIGSADLMVLRAAECRDGTGKRHVVRAGVGLAEFESRRASAATRAPSAPRPATLLRECRSVPAADS